MAGRPKEYRVQLSPDERQHLLDVVRKGRARARVIQRAHALLLSDAGRTDEGIADVLQCVAQTVRNLRKRFTEDGLEGALYDRPRPGAQPKLDGKGEAVLVALACSDPPEGREHWTMQLLADRLVELELVDAISDETVRRTLKKTN